MLGVKRLQIRGTSIRAKGALTNLAADQIPDRCTRAASVYADPAVERPEQPGGGDTTGIDVS
jgi:hypothetical protein